MYDAGCRSDCVATLQRARRASCASDGARGATAQHGAGGTASGGLSEGAVSPAGRCRVAGCGHAEHIGRRCRRRRAGQLRSPSGRSARATIASQAAERFYRALPGSAASQRAHADRRGGRRRGRVAAAGDHPVRSLRACAGICRSNLRRTRGFSAWKVWCSAAPRWARWCERASLRDVIRCGAAGDCCCTMRSAWMGRWRRLLQRRAIADGARAVATIVHVAPDAEAALDSVRAASPNMRCQRLGWHVDRAYACCRQCVAACCGGRRVGGVARRAAAAARMAVLRGNG